MERTRFTPMTPTQWEERLKPHIPFTMDELKRFIQSEITLAEDRGLERAAEVAENALEVNEFSVEQSGLYQDGDEIAESIRKLKVNPLIT